MAELLKRQFDLLALRIAMDLSGDSPKVSIQLQGRDQGELGLVADWAVEAAAMGLPERLERSGTTYQGYTFSLPADVLDEIKEVLADSDYREKPLWLHLAKPLGYLNLVPWEQLLQPALAMPMLRVPDFVANPPRESLQTLEVALCGSVPAAKSEFTAVDHLAGMAERLLATVPRRTTVHIFTDADLFEPMTRHIASMGLADVRVHDPAGAASLAPAERKYGLPVGTGRVQNPWLLWMRDALSGRSVDMVQFLAHGYVSRDRGALALAESPLQNLDERIARFVDASEIMAFLTQVGAWCAAFSSPEYNYSEMGLRLLADTVAQLRPGPVLHHEARVDDGHAALADAYRFLFGRGHFPPPGSPALFIYCNPSLLEPSVPFVRQRLRRKRGLHTREMTTEDTMSDVYAQEYVPSWVGSSQRYIEQRRSDVERILRKVDPMDPSSSKERFESAQVIKDTLSQIEAKVGHILTTKRTGEK